MLKKSIIMLAFISLATSAEAARVRGGTDTGFGTTINARNSMGPGEVVIYDDQPAAGDGINYHDKSLHNYQDPYLTNPRAYKSNENGQAAPPPRPNTYIYLHEGPPPPVIIVR